jgi:hypothetical protein
MTDFETEMRNSAHARYCVRIAILGLAGLLVAGLLFSNLAAPTPEEQKRIAAMGEFDKLKRATDAELETKFNGPDGEVYKKAWERAVETVRAEDERNNSNPTH